MKDAHDPTVGAPSPDCEAAHGNNVNGCCPRCGGPVRVVGFQSCECGREQIEQLVGAPSAPPAPEGPHRAFEIVVKVGADEWPRLVGEVQRLATHIEDHGVECGMVTGGPDVGGYVQIVQRPEMTHERYIAELEAHLAKLRGSTPEHEGNP